MSHFIGWTMIAVTMVALLWGGKKYDPDFYVKLALTGLLAALFGWIGLAFYLIGV